MDSAHQDSTPSATLAEPPLIAIPFYRNAHLVAPALHAIARCADELAALGATLALYNDSPDDPALAAALATEQPALAERISCRIEINPQNLGFVRTMNQAVAAAVQDRRDLVLLNSDTRIEPGAIAELVRVSRLDPMIGFVSPRSNNATIATLPVAQRRSNPTEADFAAFARRLPPLGFVPTCIGFCLLVRWHILAEFGGFDEIYGKGYNEENDLVMRAARCGYRAVLANHAFVWHDGEASFAGAAITRDTWERKNRAILDARYPEYAGATAAHQHRPETIAERLLAATVPDDDGQIDVAIDCSTFRADHNGTHRAGVQLVAAAARLWPPHWRLFVIATESVYDFHGFAAHGVPRTDPHADRAFAAIFRIGQPYDWNAVQRLILRGAALGAWMLDAISLDCPQLASPRLANMWQFTLDHLDLIATQSRHTAQQFAMRFRLPADAAPIVAPHSFALADYRLPTSAAPAAGTGLLIVGNHFHHKYVNATARALAVALPDRRIAVLGPKPARGPDAMAPAPIGPHANVIVHAAGELEETDIGDLYAGADAVIFPSHAEGFGFPLLHALAAGRPVFARRIPVFQELAAALDGPPNIYFFDTTADLAARLRHGAPRWIEVPVPAAPGAEAGAAIIRDALAAAIASTTFGRITDRVHAMQFASDISAPERARTNPAEAAAIVGSLSERVAHRLLRFPPFYAAGRLAFRAARRLGLRP